MNGLKVVKVAELRAKLAAIPAKLVLAVLALGVMFWDTALEKTFAAVSEKPIYAGGCFLVTYGVLSYLYFFIKLFHNYIVGIIVAAAAAYALYKGIGIACASRIIRLCGAILTAAGVYLLALWLAKFEELKLIKDLFKR